MRRLASWLLDTGPVLILAAIAGAGSFTHIRDTATDHGQTGWMSWAVAVCVDLTCVMAARERQRDKKTGRRRTGLTSWPTLVLIAGIVLSLAANLQQAEPTIWGRLTAAVPAGAFLIAVSMLERRATAPRLEPPAAVAVPASSPVTAQPSAFVPSSSSSVGAPSSVPVAVLTAQDGRTEPMGPSSTLVDYARRVADDHHAKHGKPITRDLLRSRLGVSNQLASDLLHTVRAAASEPT
ncbi:DUF2637 domain-containing protein [Planotetraspora phitsanulokensis]|uniref:SpdA protein n=1 Tax=Planotetraspora phitsanulokensis TaxID=575192 RepID=A0A8J3U1X7_9ACTN|nr:DUF2637 domain-containing protein [Planotetraspora phitsanulokensis]GII37073.1 SpdA protein [Planotetraspora phitsanulokensis]